MELQSLLEQVAEANDVVESELQKSREKYPDAAAVLHLMKTLQDAAGGSKDWRLQESAFWAGHAFGLEDGKKEFAVKLVDTLRAKAVTEEQKQMVKELESKLPSNAKPCGESCVSNESN